MKEDRYNDLQFGLADKLTEEEIEESKETVLRENKRQVLKGNFRRDLQTG